MDQERDYRVRRLAVYYRLEMATLKAAGLGNDPNAYWCSEAVGELLTAAFGLVWLKPAQYSPTTFYFMVHQLLNKGY